MVFDDIFFILSIERISMWTKRFTCVKNNDLRGITRIHLYIKDQPIISEFISHKSMEMHGIMHVYVPCRKWSGCSSNCLHSLPMKNLLPNSSVGINVPYFAIPISKGENSTHSEIRRRLWFVNLLIVKGLHKTFRPLEIKPGIKTLCIPI